MGIDKRILKAEIFGHINKTSCPKKEDMYKMMSEAERVLISYKLLKNIRLGQLKNASQMFDPKKYARFDENEKILDFMGRHDLLIELACLHSRSRAILRLNCFKSHPDKSHEGIWVRASRGYLIDDSTIREYYGDHIAIYFTWMNFFLRWMVLPALCGVGIRALNSLLYEDVGKSPFNAAFSLGMAFWGTLFACNWKRTESSLSVNWNIMYHHEERLEDIRQEFDGTPRYNPITEVKEPHYSSHSRLLHYIESLFICLPFFALVILYLIAAYNVTGVIVPGSKYDDFVMGPLAALATEGAIFDANTYWNFIPTIGQVVCTMLLNQMFSRVATFCTDRENHKYQSDYDNSLTVKRFLFEFFDCFLPLIYFGWWDLNFKVLRQNVISVYLVDELRRVFLESILPYAMASQSKYKKELRKLALNEQKRKSEEKLEKASQDDEKVREAKKRIVMLE